VVEFSNPAMLWWLLLLPCVAALRARGGTAENRTRRIIGTALRMTSVAMLVIALAGPLGGSYSRHTDVVFALDVSSSVGQEPGLQALDFINRAIAAKDIDARTALVAFGADATVETLLHREARPVREITAYVPREGTDLARAIEVAVGTFPAGGHHRLVLLSDGAQTHGDARTAAAVARSLGVQIHTVALDNEDDSDEISVRGITVPRQVRVHQPFRIQATVHSKRAARAQLLLMRQGVLFRELEVELQPGVNIFSFVDQSFDGGLLEYEAIVNADHDQEPRNNRYQAFVQVAGAPKILHVVGEPGMQRHVSDALRAQGFDVEEIAATAVPANMHQLGDYDLIILNNVSGFDLSLNKMELLDRYVRDSGGGLIMLGGEHTYAAGGYYGTPVERLLPVTMDVKSTVKIPSLAVTFVLDRSGSMGSRSQGEEKIDIAKNAALSSIALLNPLDRVGVLAFDDEAEWVVPPTEVGNRRPIAERLRSLGAGGSTDLVVALDEAVRVMSTQPAKVKHLIVLSDGLTGIDSNFSNFAAQIELHGITVSTVALGIDADQALMSRIARMGKGRFYYTDDPRNVPRIFSSEAMVISRDMIVERDTRPVLAYAGEIIEGFAEADFPHLNGYQRTYPKPAAQVLLKAADDDPLLVVWRYGLGKSVAFTSDLSGRWGRDWVRWKDFARFAAQMARWSMRRRGSENLHAQFKWQDQRGEMLVDVLDSDDRFINGLNMSATVTGPDERSALVTLESIAPGRYRGEFPVTRSGRYYVTLSGERGELQVGPRTYGLAVPYSREFIDSGVDRRLLRDIAAAADGRLLPMSGASIATILAPQERTDAGQWRIWQPFLLAALIALVLEVMARKLVLPRTWQEHLRRRSGASGDSAPEQEYAALKEQIAAVRNQHLSALRAEGHYDTDDPAVRARLYIKGQRGSGLPRYHPERPRRGSSLPR